MPLAFECPQDEKARFRTRIARQVVQQLGRPEPWSWDQFPLSAIGHSSAEEIPVLHYQSVRPLYSQLGHWVEGENQDI